jgi:hypothetical protein
MRTAAEEILGICSGRYAISASGVSVPSRIWEKDSSEVDPGIYEWKKKMICYP